MSFIATLKGLLTRFSSSDYSRTLSEFSPVNPLSPAATASATATASAATETTTAATASAAATATHAGAAAAAA